LLSWVDVLSLQRGKHSIQLGAEFRHYRWDAHANVNIYGEIDFPTFDQFLIGNSDFSTIGVGLSDRNFRASDYESLSAVSLSTAQRLWARSTGCVNCCKIPISPTTTRAVIA
jgi:hypothetical protein